MPVNSAILFLATGDDSAHLIAEGLARFHGGEKVKVVSAARQLASPHPAAVRAMSEAGHDIRDLRARALDDVGVHSFDLVVTLGAYDPGSRPDLAGMPASYHWNVREVESALADAAALDAYRATRDELARRISALFVADLPRGLALARANLELVLDNLAHAVMAHSMNRRIFHFNKAAEKITGFSRQEVLGRDCHDVFRPKRFCGGDCLFCESRARPVAATRTTEVTFERRDGDERVLEMTVQPLSDVAGAHVGALVSFKDNTELHVLRQRVRQYRSLRGLVGKDPKMLALFDQIREVAAVNVPVLIQGESGTGKELVANAIHQESPRAARPFVPINCGALPEGILESELFGHVRGAFSGAVHDKRGRFELADGGTIFLDEVAELSPATQVKLLRVLQEQCFERVGGERTVQVDVRVLSATNQDLRRLMEKRLFRRDLYYRLCVVPLTLPPLRERKTDIPSLVCRFLDEIAAESRPGASDCTRAALDLLMRYSWPGNVRELRNVIEYVAVKCRAGAFDVCHLPPELQAGDSFRRGRRGPQLTLTREQVQAALARSGKNKSRAAKLLGVGRTTLYRHLSAFGLA